MVAQSVGVYRLRCYFIANVMEGLSAALRFTMKAGSLVLRFRVP